MQLSKGNPLTTRENPEMDLITIYASREKNVVEEILVYDGAGLISQMGGILSLFLGFSFLSLIYDFIGLVEKKMISNGFYVK